MFTVATVSAYQPSLAAEKQSEESLTQIFAKAFLREAAKQIASGSLELARQKLCADSQLRVRLLAQFSSASQNIDAIAVAALRCGESAPSASPPQSREQETSRPSEFGAGKIPRVDLDDEIGLQTVLASMGGLSSQSPLLETSLRKLESTRVPSISFNAEIGRRANGEGITLLARGQIDAAISKLSVAVNQEPTNAEYVANLAYALAADARYDDAIRLSLWALQLAPRSPRTWLILGAVVGQSNMKAFSAGAFLVAAQLDGTRDTVRSQLTNCNLHPKPTSILKEACRVAVLIATGKDPLDEFDANGMGTAVTAQIEDKCGREQSGAEMRMCFNHEIPTNSAQNRRETSVARLRWCEDARKVLDWSNMQWDYCIRAAMLRM